MYFVDKEDRAAGDDLFDHLFQPLFKLAPIHCPGHQTAHIQHQNPFVEQCLGHIAFDYPLGQPFDDSCLAHTRLADQRRVVLCAAAENLDDPFNLLHPPDHRVQLAFFCGCGQVHAQLVDQGCLGLFLLLLFGLGLALQQIARGLGAHPVQVDAETPQHIDRDAFTFPHQPQKQMLSADVVMAHHPGLFHSQLDHPFGAGGQGGFAKGRAFSPAYSALHSPHHLARFHAQLFEDFDSYAIFFAHKPKQQVFGADVIMIET